MVDVRGRGDAFLDQLHRLDQEGGEHAVDREPDHVLDPDRRLAGAAASRVAVSTVLSAVSKAGMISTSFMRDTGEK